MKWTMNGEYDILTSQTITQIQKLVVKIDNISATTRADIKYTDVAFRTVVNSRAVAFRSLCITCLIICCQTECEIFIIIDSVFF